MTPSKLVTMAPEGHHPTLFEISKALGFEEGEGKDVPGRSFRRAAIAYFRDQVTTLDHQTILSGDGMTEEGLEEMAEQWERAAHKKYLPKSQLSLRHGRRELGPEYVTYPCPRIYNTTSNSQANTVLEV